MLDNQVQIDDVYYGGKLEGKSGRGSENKQAFLAAVSSFYVSSNAENHGGSGVFGNFFNKRSW
jgi:hypothetical protein